MRRYRPDDRSVVLGLAGRLTVGVAGWRDPVAVQAAVTAWVESSADAHDRADRALFVAEFRGSVVGFVSVASREHFSGVVDGYIGELAVADGRQRLGIGRALVTAAEQWSRDRGLGRVVLDTGAGNTAARTFYAALGYVEEDVRLSRPVID